MSQARIVKIYAQSLAVGILFSLPVTALLILGIHIGCLPDTRPMELIMVCAGALIATIVSAVFLKSRGIDL